MKEQTYGNPDASMVLIQLTDEHESIDSEAAEISRLTGRDFCLLALPVADWNTDLSPWPSPAVFGKEGFGGGAEKTLAEVLKRTEDRSRTFIIGGYSLSGLFALWAAHRTDVFAGVAAASPSVWFPGFVDGFMRGGACRAEAVYLSLGDMEPKTRNPVMSTVGNRIREAHELLKERGIRTVLEWNPGNHFTDADIRTARAFAWVLNAIGGEK